MKLNIFSLISFSVLFVSLFACSNDEVLPNYVTIDGQKNNLNFGYVNDLGPDPSVDHRTYNLDFRTESSQPVAFFQMELYSLSTETIAPGTYTYSSASPEAGMVSWVYSGTNMQFDDTNILTKGTMVSEDNHQQVTGTVTVTQEANNRLGFKFSFTFTDANGGNKAVEGYFDKSLSEKFIVLGTP
ncbi:MAG: hypothetical protein ACOCXH_14480 [Cyclobacteriaceae bacterium]